MRKERTLHPVVAAGLALSMAASPIVGIASTLVVPSVAYAAEQVQASSDWSSVENAGVKIDLSSITSSDIVFETTNPTVWKMEKDKTYQATDDSATGSYLAVVYHTLKASDITDGSHEVTDDAIITIKNCIDIAGIEEKWDHPHACGEHV